MSRIFERRRDTRIYYWTPITIQESGVYFLYRARLANYSGSGLYFEADLLLHPGAKVYIGIQDSTHRLFSEDYVSLLEEIIWRKRLSEKSFNYGYGAKMIFDEAGKKSQKSNHDEIKELRKNSRKPCLKSTYFASQNKYYKGVIKNINRGGAFIETRAKFSTGQKLKLVIPGTKEYILLTGEIIHINQVGFGLRFKSILKKGKAGI